MKKIILLFCLTTALCTAQQQYLDAYINRISANTICAGDSLKVDFGYTWSGLPQNKPTINVNFSITNTSYTVTAYHTTLDKVDHFPKEHYSPLAAGDSMFYFYLHIPPTMTTGNYSIQTAGGFGTFEYFPITINGQPTISVASTTVCNGQSYTFQPTGALTYTYSDGQVVTPGLDNSYTVTGTDANGCKGTEVVSITIIMDCAVGIEELYTNQPLLAPVYYDLNGLQIEKRTNQVLIEKTGNRRRKVVFQE